MDATTYDDAAYWTALEMAAADGQAPRPGWRPIAATFGGSSIGLLSGLIVSGAGPLQMAYGIAAVCIALLAAVVGWVANVLVTRRYVHVGELIRVDAAARKREGELEAEVARLRDLAFRVSETNQMAVKAATGITPRKGAAS